MHGNTPRPGLIIFDMDGTLTRPVIDFDLIRTEIGVVDRPLLEAICEMPPEDRARAEAILLRHEAAAAATSELQPGAEEVVAAIRTAKIPVTLMTRNSRDSVRAFLSRHAFTFDLIRTREDGSMKPSPDPVFEICRRFETTPSATWVIGDFHFDILCANSAGATSVLLWDSSQPRPAWTNQARHILTALSQLLPLIGLPPL